MLNYWADETFILYLLLSVAAAVIFGLCLGYCLAKRYVQREMDDQVKQALEKGKEDVERTKTHLAKSLDEQMTVIRDSIVSSAKAYQSAVVVLEKELSLSATKTLGGADMEQLQLEFKEDEETVEEAEETVEEAEERSPEQ